MMGKIVRVKEEQWTGVKVGGSGSQKLAKVAEPLNEGVTQIKYVTAFCLRMGKWEYDEGRGIN